MINSRIEIETAQLFMDGQMKKKKRNFFRIQIEYVSRKMSVFVYM